MKKVLLALAAVAALFAVSCTKKMEPVLSGEARPVHFKAELKYQFDTKATATAFQNGDEIGIFAGTPITRYNVKGTVGTDGSSVEVASPIYWQAGQTAATTFAAYFPYLSAKTPEAGSSTPMVLQLCNGHRHLPALRTRRRSDPRRPGVFYQPCPPAGGASI